MLCHIFKTGEHTDSGGNKKIWTTEDLDKMMEYIKHDALDEFFVITCFSDRMKFLKRI